MTNNPFKYPTSYSLGEIIQKVKDKNIAICFIGDKKGNIIFQDDDGNLKNITPLHRENNNYNKQELWVFANDIEDNSFRQDIVNGLFQIYCAYFQYLNRIELDLFRHI